MKFMHGHGLTVLGAYYWNKCSNKIEKFPLPQTMEKGISLCHLFTLFLIENVRSGSPQLPEHPNNSLQNT